MTPAPLLLRRSLPILIVLAIAAAVVAAVLTQRRAPVVEVVLSFTVPVPPETPLGRGGVRLGADPVDATELFVGTLAGWLASPDFVAAVYDRAGVPSPAPSVRRLSRLFTAVARGGQVVDVRFQAVTRAEGQALATAIRDEIGARTAALSAEASAFAFRVVAGEPLLLTVRPNALLHGLVAAVVVLVGGVNLVFLWDFLRMSPPLARTSDGQESLVSPG